MENSNPTISEKLNCDGFFLDTEFWTKEGAENLAKANEIVTGSLTDKHWRVINYVRYFYKKFNTGPSMISIVKNTNLTLDEICDLFPCGLVKGAYRLAGLPRPPGCI